MSTLWRWMRHEAGLKIASLVVALVLVAWRANIANPIEKRWFQDLRVEAADLDEGLVLVNRPQPVTVVLRGPRRTLDQLNQEHNVRPMLDLKGVRRNTWAAVPVTVALPNGVEAVEITPKTQLVELDAFERQEKEIRVDLAGGKPAAGFVAQAPVLRQRTAEVTGPRRAVSRVAYVAAAVDIVGLKATTSAEARLIPLDAAGMRVTGVEWKPLTVGYTVRVVPGRTERDVQVLPRLTGDPAPGWQVAAVTCQPSSAFVRGSAPLLLALENRVMTDELDVTGWKQSSARLVTLKLPEGLTAEPQAVTVRVTLEPTAIP